MRHFTFPQQPVHCRYGRAAVSGVAFQGSRHIRDRSIGFEALTEPRRRHRVAGAVSDASDLALALDAFWGEHRRCGELDAGVEEAPGGFLVWAACGRCGAWLAWRLSDQPRPTPWEGAAVAAPDCLAGPRARSFLTSRHPGLQFHVQQRRRRPRPRAVLATSAGTPHWHRCWFLSKVSSGRWRLWAGVGTERTRKEPRHDDSDDAVRAAHHCRRLLRR